MRVLMPVEADEAARVAAAPGRARRLGVTAAVAAVARSPVEPGMPARTGSFGGEAGDG